jgi:hypothetical protein
METYTPSPVRYYVGDLCYVLNTDDWFDLCSATGDPDNVDDTGSELPDGRFFIYMPTAYGDGCYNDQNGLSYCVDSGGIGAIRTDYADPEKLADAVTHGLGHVLEFPCELDGMDAFEADGVLTIFDVIIDTSGALDEDEEEVEEEDG